MQHAHGKRSPAGRAMPFWVGRPLTLIACETIRLAGPVQDSWNVGCLRRTLDFFGTQLSEQRKALEV